MSIYAVINQKGGVGKTTTTANLGVALAQQGKRVLLVDLDPQANLTLMFGYKPKELDRTLSECMAAASNNEPSFGTADALIHSDESVDILPGAQSLAGFESSVAGRPGREQMLANVLGEVAENYDTVLIDCPPTLGQLAINALYAANKTLIPTQPEILSLQGLEQLISTVNLTRRQLNPTLQLGGILLTMTGRAKLGREIAETLRATYGAFTRVFDTEIPRSVKAGEAVAAHKSIFGYAPKCKVAAAYADLASEVLTAERSRSTNRTKAKAARAAAR